MQVQKGPGRATTIVPSYTWPAGVAVSAAGVSFSPPVSETTSLLLNFSEDSEITLQTA